MVSEKLTMCYVKHGKARLKYLHFKHAVGSIHELLSVDISQLVCMYHAWNSPYNTSDISHQDQSIHIE